MGEYIAPKYSPHLGVRPSLEATVHGATTMLNDNLPGPRAGAPRRRPAWSPHARADLLYPAFPRSPDPLRRGRGAGPHRRPRRGRADDGGLDAGLLPGARVRPQRRGGLGRHRTRASRWPSRRPSRTAGGSTTRQAPGGRPLPGLLPRDVGADQLRRLRLRAAQRRRRRSSTLADDEPRPRPYEVRLELPAAWKVSASPLPASAGAGDRTPTGRRTSTPWSTRPIYAGNARIHPFEVAGKPHLLVNEGEGAIWDGPRSAADAEKIVREQVAFWGVAPYPRYVVLQPAHRERRRAGAQGRLHPDEQPLAHPHPRGVSRLAGAGRPRALPRLERQAPAAGRARAVRLRARGLHPRASGWPRGSPPTTATCWSHRAGFSTARST